MGPVAMPGVVEQRAPVSIGMAMVNLRVNSFEGGSMSDPGILAASPLFPQDYRASGLLLHITSLPSPYGTGDLGPEAFTWIDRLHEAGQSWWQLLPLGPTGYADSPYQCLSSFAGNGLLISPHFLIEDGLLRADDCRGSFSATSVDYDVVIPFKHRLLGLAWASFQNGSRKDLRPSYEDFCHSRAGWLDDYALFRALRTKYRNAPYLKWPQDLVHRVPSALARARQNLAENMDQIRFAQFLLFRQGNCLKDYARARGVRLIGDLPFFVSPDSSDVWANPELFQLDANREPDVVAGVPPDYFSAQGQLWGNPVYNWDAHRRTGYMWFIARIRALLAHVDVIRLDHFRAFAAAWHVPAGEPTAESGQWVPGPGAHLFNAIQNDLGNLPFIAEDLGHITPDVSALRHQFQVPGTRVLQFAFDGNPSNDHLPHRCGGDTVLYTGTHDNPTTREWFGALSDRERRSIWNYLRRAEGDTRDATPELIRLAWSSTAALAITSLQDLLNIGREGRMNVPGRASRNWRWRATPHMLSTGSFQWLRELTELCGRSEAVGRPRTRGAS
jgi:4-alpha-glucanotransferase